MEVNIKIFISHKIVNGISNKEQFRKWRFTESSKKWNFNYTPKAHIEITYIIVPYNILNESTLQKT